MSSTGRSPTRPTSTAGIGSSSGTPWTSSASPPTSPWPTATPPASSRSWPAGPGPSSPSRPLPGAGIARSSSPRRASRRSPRRRALPGRRRRSAADVWLQARCYEATLQGARRASLDRGRLLLALGALLEAGVPGPLPHHPRQARQVHHGPLVLRPLTAAEVTPPGPCSPGLLRTAAPVGAGAPPLRATARGAPLKPESAVLASSGARHASASPSRSVGSALWTLSRADAAPSGRRGQETGSGLVFCVAASPRPARCEMQDLTPSVESD